MVYGGSSKATWKTFQTLEQELRDIHENKYSYDNAVFINARTPMLITCPEHGDFLQRSRDHKRGKGCRVCFVERNALNRTKDAKVLIEELRKIDKYIYPKISEDEIIKSHDRIFVQCSTCGKGHTPKVYNILSGHSGCSGCRYSKSSWTSDRYKGKKTLLYYVRIGDLYKVGLTRKTVASRFYKELQAGFDIEVIFTIEYVNGEEAFKEEQRILQEYSIFRYKGDKMLINGGNSELLTTDVFQHGGVPSKQ